MEIDIGIDHRIIADFCPLVVLTVLYGKYSHTGTVIRGIIGGKVSHVNSQICIKYPGNLETKVHVGVYIQGWHR
jgi:hypothetical protein